MVAGGHRIIARDALNLVVLYSLSTPTNGHTLVTITLMNNHTASTVDRTGTIIELNQWGLRKKQPTIFLIYTACCCSASNLTLHAFNLNVLLGGVLVEDEENREQPWLFGVQ